ncbi:YdcF family protein [Kineosporia rhizophila]|uniref:YdcF family protein n=1 Tax=Kineosporia TaxID=49184 RepID=UPI001E5F1134|nr:MULTISPECIES: ElyC/SanA/YdcF family protein [Kineosporia]MCE0535175.1 YdcF family protein [Kineosporia rhizophila]GLY14538.1 hypothetical protein Kisp01_15530 [Kineosporia sp. NBRC 101677]
MTAPGGERRGALITLPPRRWIRRTAIASVVFALVVGVGGGRLYSFPRTDVLKPGDQVDAVLALGGRTETAYYAISMAEQGITPVVLVSNPYPQDEAFQGIHDLCATRPTTYELICFDPDPRTTRGEAQELGRLAAGRGWDEVAVVAAKYHISRTRTITKRCYPGRLYLVEAPMEIPPANWVYQYVRQTLGYAKVALQQGC